MPGPNLGRMQGKHPISPDPQYTTQPCILTSFIAQAAAFSDAQPFLSSLLEQPGCPLSASNPRETSNANLPSWLHLNPLEAHQTYSGPSTQAKTTHYFMDILEVYLSPNLEL